MFSAQARGAPELIAKRFRNRTLLGQMKLNTRQYAMKLGQREEPGPVDVVTSKLVKRVSSSGVDQRARTADEQRELWTRSTGYFSREGSRHRLRPERRAR